MSQSQKHQEYTYSMKTGVISNIQIPIGSALTTNWNGERGHGAIVAPENAIAIQYLRTRFKFRFDAGTNVAHRIVRKIGIIDIPTFEEDHGSYTPPNYQRYFDLNVTADANREVDININLTSLLKKDNVVYFVEPTLNPPTKTAGGVGGRTLVDIQFHQNLPESSGDTGIVLLWSIDALFITDGIR